MHHRSHFSWLASSTLPPSVHTQAKAKKWRAAFSSLAGAPFSSMCPWLSASCHCDVKSCVSAITIWTSHVLTGSMSVLRSTTSASVMVMSKSSRISARTDAGGAPSPSSGKLRCHHDWTYGSQPTTACS